MILAVSNHMKFIIFGAVDSSEFACKGSYSKLFPALSSFQKFQTERELTGTVDLAIDGPRPSSSSRRAENVGERESGRGATCRRRASAGRLGVDGGGPGQQLGGGVGVGEAPQRPARRRRPCSSEWSSGSSSAAPAASS